MFIQINAHAQGWMLRFRKSHQQHSCIDKLCWHRHSRRKSLNLQPLSCVTFLSFFVPALIDSSNSIQWKTAKEFYDKLMISMNCWKCIWCINIAGIVYPHLFRIYILCFYLNFVVKVLKTKIHNSHWTVRISKEQLFAKQMSFQDIRLFKTFFVGST